jgi:hypothetical protein
MTNAIQGQVFSGILTFLLFRALERYQVSWLRQQRPCKIFSHLLSGFNNARDNIEYGKSISEVCKSWHPLACTYFSHPPPPRVS